MHKLQYMAIAGAAAIGLTLTATQPVRAAALDICDAPNCGAPEGSVIFNVNDFEGGFQVNGTTIQSGLGNPVSVPFSESGPPNPINGSAQNTFSGSWILGGPIVPTSQTVFFTEPGGGHGPNIISDVLQFTYTENGGLGQLTGTVISDATENGLNVNTLRAMGFIPTLTVLETAGPFDFSNTNITATFESDVPEPASLALLGGGLLGFAFAWRRKRT